MTPANVVGVLKFLARRKRFKPFTIVLHGNERIEVKHPELIQIQGSIIVFQEREEANTVFDGESVNRIIIP